MIKILLTVILAINIYATEIEDIQSSFEAMAIDIVKIVQNKSLSASVRNDTIIDTITPFFDFKLMAKLSLGKTWKTMDKDKQAKFIKLYVNRMKKAYSSKIDKYTDEKIVVISIKQVKKTRVVLNTDLINGEDKLDIVYKYYKPKTQLDDKKRWLVYDAVIAGVSLIKTDKAQFLEVIQDSSLDKLMEKLK